MAQHTGVFSEVRRLALLFVLASARCRLYSWYDFLRSLIRRFSVVCVIGIVNSVRSSSDIGAMSNAPRISKSRKGKRLLSQVRQSAKRFYVHARRTYHSIQARTTRSQTA